MVTCKFSLVVAVWILAASLAADAQRADKVYRIGYMSDSDLLAVLPVVLTFFLVLFVLVAPLIVAHRKRKARQEPLEACGRRLGFRFDAKGASFNFKEWADLDLSGTARNVISGQRNDLDIAALDLHIGFQGVRTAVLVRSAGLGLPGFWLGKPEEDREYRIPFTDYPKFSQLYAVYSEDQPRVRSIFTSAVIDFFSGHDGLIVEGSAERLAVYRQKRGIVEPDAVPSLIEQSVTIAELFKARRTDVR